MSEDYKTWSLGDWMWCLSTWDEAMQDWAWAHGQVRPGRDEDIIEFVQERYSIGDLEGKALVDELRNQVAEAAKRLGCDEPIPLKWNI